MKIILLFFILVSQVGFSQLKVSYDYKSYKYGLKSGEKVHKRDTNWIVQPSYKLISSEKINNHTFFITVSDKGFGILDEFGKKILEEEYSYIGIPYSFSKDTSERYQINKFLVQKDRTKGLLNPDGSFFLDIEYTQIKVLNNNLLLLTKEDLYKGDIIDTNKNIIFKESRPFIYSTNYLVKTKTEKFGIIDENGKIISDTVFDNFLEITQRSSSNGNNNYIILKNNSLKEIVSNESMKWNDFSTGNKKKMDSVLLNIFFNSYDILKINNIRFVDIGISLNYFNYSDNSIDFNSTDGKEISQQKLGKLIYKFVSDIPKNTNFKSDLNIDFIFMSNKRASILVSYNEQNDSLKYYVKNFVLRNDSLIDVDLNRIFFDLYEELSYGRPTSELDEYRYVKMKNVETVFYRHGVRKFYRYVHSHVDCCFVPKHIIEEHYLYHKHWLLEYFYDY